MSNTKTEPRRARNVKPFPKLVCWFLVGVASTSLSFPAHSADATSNPHPTDFGFQVQRAGVADSVSPSAIPTCNTGYFLTSSGNGFVCTAPSAGAVPPNCGGGSVLTYTGGGYSCVNSISGNAGTAGYATTTGSIDLTAIGLPGWPQAILCNQDYSVFYRITAGRAEYDNPGGVFALYDLGSRSRVGGSASCPGSI